MAGKKLFIMRHGKSDWNAQFKRDHERPLAARGVEAAALMGKHLQSIRQVPELVISSNAKRTADTIDIAISHGTWEAQLKKKRELYLASAGEISEIIQQVSNTVKTLMLVGHEPMCSSLIAELCMGAHVKFPTAAVARINLNIDSWSELASDTGRLDWLLTPKALQQI
ncbi:histidine phosphatase family protein [Kangiella sp. HZ709]|uniref:SixA phosphatase family protein n=1 Tax=Kangiella sp. HZ709 TaxID=2666328 RepID=UPI0012B03786|nr:histidine phosphatase family protein [Kangiella sp. HZ709]MRX26695.1 histidine phosphatase family protein [Kangiella sp. HZ709]